VTLTKELRWEIQTLAVRLSNAANEEELLRRGSARAKSREQNELELMLVISDIKKLLARIEDAVPLINLAITTSGVNLTTNLPATISPSRLLQASAFLTAADSQYASSAGHRTQVGPTYTLSMYMLFAGHAYRPHEVDDVRETTWKEVIHKARVKLLRVSLDKLYDLPGEDRARGGTTSDNSIPVENAVDEFAYQIQLIEDLDDDRVHTFEDDEPQPGPVDDVLSAGIRDVVPIHEISKIFYADTGKILNIGTEGEVNHPVLLLKRDIYAEAPRRMMEGMQSHEAYADDEAYDLDVDDSAAHSGKRNGGHNEQAELEAQIRRESFMTLPVEPETPSATISTGPWRLPPNLDPEWIAFEVYNEELDSEDESEVPSSAVDRSSSNPPSSRQGSVDPELAAAISEMNLRGSSTPPSPSTNGEKTSLALPPTAQLPIKTSLSLLEMLIRLTALQQFRQSSHLTIEDELLNFFLEDSSTTGAGPNAEYRQRVRRDARRRVGFDPYDESPIKRRGEEYLAHPRASPRPDDRWDGGSQYANSRQGTPDYARSSVEYHPYRTSEVAQSSSPSPFVRPRPVSTRSSPAPATPAHPRSAQTMTPPGSLRSRQAALRTQSEKPRSPLGLGIRPATADSTLGTSPSSEDLQNESKE